MKEKFACQLGMTDELLGKFRNGFPTDWTDLISTIFPENTLPETSFRVCHDAAVERSTRACAAPTAPIEGNEPNKKPTEKGTIPNKNSLQNRKTPQVVAFSLTRSQTDKDTVTAKGTWDAAAVLERRSKRARQLCTEESLQEEDKDDMLDFKPNRPLRKKSRRDPLKKNQATKQNVPTLNETSKKISTIPEAQQTKATCCNVEKKRDESRSERPLRRSSRVSRNGIRMARLSLSKNILKCLDEKPDNKHENVRLRNLDEVPPASQDKLHSTDNVNQAVPPEDNLKTSDIAMEADTEKDENHLSKAGTNLVPKRKVDKTLRPVGPRMRRVGFMLETETISQAVVETTRITRSGLALRNSGVDSVTKPNGSNIQSKETLVPIKTSPVVAQVKPQKERAIEPENLKKRQDLSNASDERKSPDLEAEIPVRKSLRIKALAQHNGSVSKTTKRKGAATSSKTGLKRNSDDVLSHHTSKRTRTSNVITGQDSGIRKPVARKSRITADQGSNIQELAARLQRSKNVNQGNQGNQGINQGKVKESRNTRSERTNRRRRKVDENENTTADGISEATQAVGASEEGKADAEITSSSKSGKLKCSLCGREYISKSGLAKHIKLKHELKSVSQASGKIDKHVSKPSNAGCQRTGLRSITRQRSTYLGETKYSAKTRGNNRVSFEVKEEESKTKSPHRSSTEDWTETQKVQYDKQRNTVPGDSNDYWEQVAAGVTDKSAMQCEAFWKRTWTSPRVAQGKQQAKKRMGTPEVLRAVQRKTKNKRSRETGLFRTQVRRLGEVVARDREDDLLEPKFETPTLAGEVKWKEGEIIGLGDGTPGTEVRLKRKEIEREGKLVTPEILARGRRLGLREADQYVSLFRRRLGAAAVAPVEIGRSGKGKGKDTRKGKGKGKMKGDYGECYENIGLGDEGENEAESDGEEEDEGDLFF